MDYCIPCSRTLNSAVTCPECGAYDSDMAELSNHTGGAPRDDTAIAKVHVPEGLPPFGSAGDPGSAPPAPDLSAARNRPPRLKKYAVRSLAAAAFTILGGLATASVLPQSTAPRAASIPEGPSPDELQGPVSDSPTSLVRVTTHPARKGVQDRNSDGIRRPVPTPTRSERPTSRPPSTTSAPPRVKPRPTPRPSSSGHPNSPKPTATASARPSASPSSSISPSPTSSRSPSGGETAD